MTSSPNKNTCFALLFAMVAVLYTSCKETNKEPETVEFDLTQVESGIITVDSVIDSSSTSDNYYKVSISLNNDFFRVACEENAVYLDDVESVTLKSADVEFLAPSGGSLASFKNISQYAVYTDFGAPTLMSSSQTISGSPLTLSLTPSANNLKQYFRLYYTPIEIYLSQHDLNFTSADLKFKFIFHVKGTNH